MSKPIPPRRSRSLLLLLVTIPVFVESSPFNYKHDDSRCEKFDTCASCTRARYGAATDAILTENDDSISASTARHLRNDPKKFLNGIWNHGPHCKWCPRNELGDGGGSCRDISSDYVCESTDDADDDLYIKYESTCPLSPIPYPKRPPEFLPNWMGTLFNQTGGGDITILDLSLPGSHDSLTYDLSLTMSDDGIDSMQRLAKLLHFLSGGSLKLLPGELEEFIRLQGMTQKLSIEEQLDNGVRFIDFRIMLEQDSNGKEWRSLHGMQSKNLAKTYLHQIRNWMDLHPFEIIIIWFSKQGDTNAVGDVQYPHVSIQDKLEMWNTYTSIFHDLLINTRLSKLNQTSVHTLLNRNHRVITFVSDYLQFTNSSHLALDAKSLQNFFHDDGGVTNEPQTMQTQRSYFRSAKRRNQEAKSRSVFTLMSMNTPDQGWQVEYAARGRFLSWFRNDVKCSGNMNNPGLVDWCPESVMDIAQLSSYYNQIAIEEAFLKCDKFFFYQEEEEEEEEEGWAFPNAFYLDALDYGGTIRTGRQLLFGTLPHGADGHVEEGHNTSSSESGHHSLFAGYAYVDTVIAYNALVLCAHQDKKHVGCNDLMKLLENRRLKHPLRLWNDPRYGRHQNWP